MENRNELSDIVLEKGDSKTLKLKRILILVAFLILVFLVALASMKMMNKEPSKETSKLILPPEPSAQEAPVTKDDQLFKQVPIIEENPKKESFEEMIKTLKEKEAQKQEEAKVKESATQTTAPIKSETPKVTETKPKEESVKKEVAKPKEAPAPVSQQSTSADAGIYIQIGAVATAPEQKVLNDIKSKGFEYRLYKTVVNGNNVTKILIGPYAKSEDAQNALISVRASINKNAFIYRIK
ncbi:MAG: SPOR domain-containing protein [Sulfurospirillum sp.]|jgi:DedD protein|nr:SPOR domain-containing protein [Sulfurospirillum sp.]MBP9612616.1 SPOR domain-containing protein [Sulfurospirillum sp.]